MNALLRRSQHFSMTEAERLKLQADSDALLERAAQMLERSDELLLDAAKTPAIQQQGLKKQILWERQELGSTQLFAH